MGTSYHQVLSPQDCPKDRELNSSPAEAIYQPERSIAVRGLHALIGWAMSFCKPCHQFVASFFESDSAKAPLPTRNSAGGAFETPVIGVGCWSFGSTADEYWGERPQDVVNDTVKAALEYGCALFDTAEAYQDGRSEASLGAALQLAGDLGPGALVASKILPNNCSSAAELRRHLDATLARLKVDSIYLYQVHWPLTQGMGNVKETFQELASLQREGKIKHIGVSNFGVKQLTDALSTGVTIATNQLMYNLLSRGIEHEVVQLCAEHDIGIICYSPLLQGLLTDRGNIDEADSYRTRTRHFSGARDKSRHREEGAEEELRAALSAIQDIAKREKRATHELAMAWCLANPHVVSIIPGARDRRQLESNMNVAFNPISTALKQELDGVTDELKAKLGPYIDYYASKEAQRSF